MQDFTSHETLELNCQSGNYINCPSSVFSLVWCEAVLFNSIEECAYVEKQKFNALDFQICLI